MEGNLSVVQLRYKNLVGACGLDHEAAMYALGRRNGPAPEYERLRRNEKLREIDRLTGQGLSLVEARRVVGLYRSEETVQAIIPHTPVTRLTAKAQRKAAKRRREFAKYYNALTRSELRGLKGVLK